MIILCLEDGLGNQMFEYAFARTIQEHFNEELLIATGQFDLPEQKYPELKYALKELRIVPSIRFTEKQEGKDLWETTCKRHDILKRVLWRLCRGDWMRVGRIESFFGIYSDVGGPWTYLPIFPCNKKKKFLLGRWQSEKFFLPVAEKMKNELRVKKSIETNLSKCIDEIERSESVAVHIRLGDYATDPGLRLCGREYYLKGMRMLQQKLKNPTFYIFTNSPRDYEYLYSHFQPDPNMTVVYMNENRTVVEDYCLMYHCRHYIISNSSLSWWAQYMTLHDGGYVIAPSRWNTLGLYDGDIYQEHWTRIEP